MLEGELLQHCLQWQGSMGVLHNAVHGILNTILSSKSRISVCKPRSYRISKKMIIDLGWDGIGLTDLAHYRDRWRGLVYFQFP
jgi:hypothetical protein